VKSKKQKAKSKKQKAKSKKQKAQSKKQKAKSKKQKAKARAKSKAKPKLKRKNVARGRWGGGGNKNTVPIVFHVMGNFRYFRVVFVVGNGRGDDPRVLVSVFLHRLSLYFQGHF
jgi:hypothetical protein